MNEKDLIGDIFEVLVKLLFVTWYSFNQIICVTFHPIKNSLSIIFKIKKMKVNFLILKNKVLKLPNFFIYNNTYKIEHFILFNNVALKDLSKHRCSKVRHANAQYSMQNMQYANFLTAESTGLRETFFYWAPTP